MKVLLNKSKRIYQYGIGSETINFNPGTKMEFEDNIADSFLNSPEIELVSDDTILKAKDEEILKLKAEIESKSEKKGKKDI